PLPSVTVFVICWVPAVECDTIAEFRAAGCDRHHGATGRWRVAAQSIEWVFLRTNAGHGPGARLARRDRWRQSARPRTPGLMRVVPAATMVVAVVAAVGVLMAVAIAIRVAIARLVPVPVGSIVAIAVVVGRVVVAVVLPVAVVVAVVLPIAVVVAAVSAAFVGAPRQPEERDQRSEAKRPRTAHWSCHVDLPSKRVGHKALRFPQR